MSDHHQYQGQHVPPYPVRLQAREQQQQQEQQQQEEEQEPPSKGAPLHPQPYENASASASSSSLSSSASAASPTHPSTLSGSKRPSDAVSGPEPTSAIASLDAAPSPLSPASRPTSPAEKGRTEEENSGAVPSGAPKKARKSSPRSSPRSSQGGDGASVRSTGTNAAKGLRHFSMMVCQKVEEKGTTTYNEVADELVKKVVAERKEEDPGGSFDQKNIRRRVYDALNVLMAMDIISKEKKEITWKGLPTAARQDMESMEKEIELREHQIAQKKEALRDLLVQQVCFRNLVQRNHHQEQARQLQHHQERKMGVPEGKIPLPFLVVNTDKSAETKCDMSKDLTFITFNFSLPFEVSDDNTILKGMEMDRTSSANLRQMFPEDLLRYCEANRLTDAVLGRGDPGEEAYSHHHPPQHDPHGHGSQFHQHQHHQPHNQPLYQHHRSQGSISIGGGSSSGGSSGSSSRLGRVALHEPPQQQPPHHPYAHAHANAHAHAVPPSPYEGRGMGGPPHGRRPPPPHAVHHHHNHQGPSSVASSRMGSGRDRYSYYASQ